jgi:hypothetical protein
MAHAAALCDSLTAIRKESEAARQATRIVVTGAPSGITVEFESPPRFDLKLQSLENKQKGIELLNVRYVSADTGDPVQLATVFIPDGALKHFFDRFQQYAEERTRKGEPRHKDLVDRITKLRKATLRALWTDAEVHTLTTERRSGGKSGCVVTTATNSRASSILHNRPISRSANAALALMTG